jgi:hypothetical protein
VQTKERESPLSLGDLTLSEGRLCPLHRKRTRCSDRTEFVTVLQMTFGSVRILFPWGGAAEESKGGQTSRLSTASTQGWKVGTDLGYPRAFRACPVKLCPPLARLLWSSPQRRPRTWSREMPHSGRRMTRPMPPTPRRGGTAAEPAVGWQGAGAELGPRHSEFQ